MNEHNYLQVYEQMRIYRKAFSLLVKSIENLDIHSDYSNEAYWLNRASKALERENELESHIDTLFSSSF